MNYTCRDIMIDHPLTLHPAMTIAEAFEVIHHRGVRYFPVVDDAGDFVGIFSSMSLIELLLPRGITANPARGKKLPELDFMKTTVEELRYRLSERGHEPITDYLTTESIPLLHPETSLMEALYLIYQYHSHAIIVEKGGRRFLGVVSINGILDHIQGAKG